MLELCSAHYTARELIETMSTATATDRMRKGSVSSVSAPIVSDGPVPPNQINSPPPLFPVFESDDKLPWKVMNPSDDADGPLVARLSETTATHRRLLNRLRKSPYHIACPTVRQVVERYSDHYNTTTNTSNDISTVFLSRFNAGIPKELQINGCSKDKTKSKKVLRSLRKIKEIATELSEDVELGIDDINAQVNELGAEEATLGDDEENGDGDDNVDDDDEDLEEEDDDHLDYGYRDDEDVGDDDGLDGSDDGGGTY